jgi:hypothetical protein
MIGAGNSMSDNAWAFRMRFSRAAFLIARAGL